MTNFNDSSKQMLWGGLQTRYIKAPFFPGPKGATALLHSSECWPEGFWADWLLQVLPEHRNQAKQLAYGVLYGMGHARLADGLKCSLAEAKEHQEAFMRALPGLVSPLFSLCRSPYLCVMQKPPLPSRCFILLCMFVFGILPAMLASFGQL